MMLQHRVLHALQLRPRHDAELLIEQTAGRLVGGQCVGLPPAPVEGDHELGPQPLPQRVLLYQFGELAHQVGVHAEGEVGARPRLERLETKLPEPVHGAGDEGRAHPGQGRSVPQGQGLRQELRRPPGIVPHQGPPLGDEPFEAGRVDLFRRHPQRVTARLRN